MSKRKYTVCIIMCLCFILSVSCSAGTAVLLPFLDTDTSNDDLKFDGYEFVLVNAPDPADPTYPSTVTGDAILARYKEVESNRDIKIKIKTEDSGSFISNVNIAVAAGTKHSDLTLNWIEFIHTAYNAGLVMPVDEVDGLDLSSGILGSEAMLEAARFSDGHIYGIQAEKWPIMPGITLTGMLYYNPLVIKEYNQTDPMELYESGKWTWDTYQTLSNGCTVHSEGVYGTVALHDEFILNAIFSNDGDVIKYNEETGKYYIALGDEDAVEAIEWCQELVNIDKCLLILSDGAGEEDAYVNYFEDGISAFVNADTTRGFGSFLENLDTGFNWIPFPVGPSNEDASDNSKTIMYSTYYAIPLNYDFDEVIFSTIVNDLFEPIEDQMEWRDYYCQYMIADDSGKSSEIFLHLLDSSKTANMHYFTIQDRVDHLAHPLRDIQKEVGGITEMLQKHVPALQAHIDKAFNE